MSSAVIPSGWDSSPSRQIMPPAFCNITWQFADATQKWNEIVNLMFYF